ncbi:MAG: hypothetical protein MUF14_10595, partial [Hyphomonadaceae bacterium]|nr:hypothetical protein [Hyphomonadaceae bacterium]
MQAQTPASDPALFAQTPWMAEVAISNDGTMLAWAQRGDNGSQNLMIRETGGQRIRTISSQGQRIYEIDFKTNTRIIGSFLDQNRRHDYGITFAIDISEGETTNRSRLGRFVEMTGAPLALLPDDPDHVLTDSFFAFDEDLGGYALVTPTIRKDSLSEHNSVKVDDAVPLAFDYVATPEGRIVAAAKYDYDRDRASIDIRNADGTWREVFAQENDKLRQLSLLGMRGTN